MSEQLTIALSKGRIYKETLPLLAAADIVPLEDPESSRKLIIETNQPGINLLIVRASDVPTYTCHGGADVGIVGKDVLMEHGGEGLYELLDLKIACCKLMVAGDPNIDLNTQKRLRVATKFVNCARRYFASRSQQVEIIKLYGSMELAPLVGMADLIVDVVDTGNTLRANGLEPLLDIAPISSRLIVNKASMKTKHRMVTALVERLAAKIEQRELQHV